MTNEEAINEILAASGEELKYGDMSRHAEAVEKRVIAFEMACTALNKNIPKKPNDIRIKKHGKNDFEMQVEGRCPACNKRQSIGSLWWHKTFNKRCDDCGQSLDWSDS